MRYFAFLPPVMHFSELWPEFLLINAYSRQRIYSVLHVLLTPSAEFQLAGYCDTNHPFATEKSGRKNQNNYI